MALVRSWRRSCSLLYKQKQTRDTRFFFFNSLYGPIWMVFGGPKTQHGELFSHSVAFFLQKKNPNSQQEISVVNSDFFSA